MILYTLILLAFIAYVSYTNKLHKQQLDLAADISNLTYRYIRLHLERDGKGLMHFPADPLLRLLKAAEHPVAPGELDRLIKETTTQPQENKDEL